MPSYALHYHNIHSVVDRHGFVFHRAPCPVWSYHASTRHSPTQPLACVRGSLGHTLWSGMAALWSVHTGRSEFSHSPADSRWGFLLLHILGSWIYWFQFLLFPFQFCLIYGRSPNMSWDNNFFTKVLIMKDVAIFLKENSTKTRTFVDKEVIFQTREQVS